MSSLYLPNPALVNSTSFVQTLSQRDLSLRIPLNFVNQPGVNLRAACFSNSRYEDVAAATCFSNLLAAGFRRLEADVFWDTSRSNWSLCPVQLGAESDGVTTSTSSVATAALDTVTSLSNGVLTDRHVPSAIVLAKRQGTEALTVPTAAASTTADVATSSPTSTATLAADPSTSLVAGSDGSSDTQPQDGTLVQAGPYSCTSSVDLALLTSILSAHFIDTETNLDATTVVLTLNLHAAAAASDPAGSAPQPDDVDLPQESSLLSSIIERNASAYLYTPSNLLSQRASLNSSQSWFTVFAGSRPNAAYFETETSGSTTSTPDGWPGEGYVELEFAKRLLVGLGEIDPQMANYNVSGDEATIFLPRYLQSNANATTSSSGSFVTGCFFDSEITNLADVNSSWAVSSIGSGDVVDAAQLPLYLETARNLTSCGISPLLNITLGSSANQNYEPYLDFVRSTVWSWSAGQPVNSSQQQDLTEYRCAALNGTSGTWQASDCSEARYGACRIGNEPYGWTITETNAPYSRVDLACGYDQRFDVPRTALENNYLLSTWRQYREDGRDEDSGSPLLWLNFNDLDIASCWVIGQNSTCPYEGLPEQQTRRIVVPVVGGILVFGLTILVILVKCAGNRQNSKRKRKRGEGGWDYEGVPS